MRVVGHVDAASPRHGGGVARASAAARDDAQRELLPVEPPRFEMLDRGLERAPGQRFDLVVLPIFTDERPLTGLAGLLDWRECGRLSALLRREFCTGERGERVLTTVERCPWCWRVMAIGLGPRADFDDVAAGEAVSWIRSAARSVHAHTVVLGAPGSDGGAHGSRLLRALARALAETAGAADEGGEEEATARELASAAPARWWAVADARARDDDDDDESPSGAS